MEEGIYAGTGTRVGSKKRPSDQEKGLEAMEADWGAESGVQEGRKKGRNGSCGVKETRGYGQTSKASIPTKYQHVLFLKEKLKGFNSSSDKHSFKKLLKRRFNREPGPATYKIRSPKSKFSRRGYTNGFASHNERYQSEEQSPGPGDYETTKPKKSICKVSYKSSSPNIKALEGKNPLNYVLPLTVNLYFKKNNPGPGEYSPKKEMAEQIKNEYKSVFNSKSQRRLFSRDDDYNFLKYSYNHQTIQEDARKMTKLKKRVQVRIPNKTIGDTLEEIKYRYECLLIAFRTKGALSQDFTQSTEDIRNPSYTSLDAPAYQGDISHNLNKKRDIYTSNFALQNTDRFGAPIFNKQRAFKIPGPGRYKSNKASKIKGGIIGSQKKKMFNEIINKVPGPCFYSVKKDSKKASFLFNRDQKWIS
ncbi:unnamed protein product [Moneuplotes crassus]|uniref:Uncharacterized protein n=1 Tax=Euplotes crassus TaxID=5936 RepID=A0AAD1X8X4_EUPCR|nr:unnamed protein product [Moneuplotes crassus]